MILNVKHVEKSISEFVKNGVGLARAKNRCFISIINITNFQDLLFSFDEEHTHNAISVLHNFVLKKFGNKYTVCMHSNSQIFICGFTQSKEEIIKEIDNFFYDFKKYCDTKKVQLYFSLDFISILFQPKPDKGTAHEISKKLLSQISVLLQEAIRSSIRYNILVYNDDEVIFLKRKNDNDLARYFREAINDNRLTLAYQPIVDVRTSEVVKYEALLRVITQEGDCLSAAPFVRIAEKMGFIDQIDNFVMDNVLQDLKQFPNLTLAMNLSNLTVYNNYLSQKAQKSLTPSLASRLILEITETGNLSDFNLLSDFANRMRALGCKIAIDDFGVGNTSIAQLKKIKADIIKIDGQFVHHIAHRNENKAFVSAILKLVSEIGAKSIAEFIESQETINIIKELGVDYLQGNFISQALNYKPWTHKS